MFLLSLCFMLFSNIVSSQLIVNVKNNGGDVYRETIDANTTQDTVSLDFRKSDGTIVKQFIDGKNEIQIFKVVILPEEERGQTQVQTMCFILRFAKTEFISSDAMSKLRQKNPSAIRHPEESRPEEFIPLDLLVNVGSSQVLSPHIAEICSDAAEMIFMSDSTLRLLSQIFSRDYQVLQSITQKAQLEGVVSCQKTDDLSQPCACHYGVCVGWYPCGLKYCRGKDSANRVVSYRCGIKTCSKCRTFEFFVPHKALCIWDEPEFTFEAQEGTTKPELVTPASQLSEKQLVPSQDREVQVGQLEPGKVLPVNRGGTMESQEVVKMEQKVLEEVKDVEMKVEMKVEKSLNDNKPSDLGKNSELDDDEDGE